MKRISVRYAVYYNRKYGRIDPLFQDRYKSEAIETDAYFLTVLRYIHRNPVKAGIVKSPSEYLWSSYKAYLQSTRAGFVFCGLGNEMLDGQFIEYMETDDSEKCLDNEDTNKQLTDIELSAIIEAMIHIPAPTIAAMKREERGEALRRIVTIPGATYRQISRVTGLSPTMISRAINE